MSRDYKVYLEDILEAIHKIRAYTAGMSLPTFTADAKTFDAVVRNLEIIGEAAKGLPEPVRAGHAKSIGNESRAFAIFSSTSTLAWMPLLSGISCRTN